MVTPEELVLKQFPGRLYITLVEAGAAIGLAEQTTRNRRAKGKFPLPIRMIGDRPMVALSDLIAFMNQGRKRVLSIDEVPEKRARSTKRQGSGKELVT